MAEIIEPQIGLSAAAAIILEIKGFGAGHVGSGTRRGTRRPGPIRQAGGRRWLHHPGVVEWRENSSGVPASGMSIDDTIAPTASTGRPPAVLQVLPSLVSGGAERGTVELARSAGRGGMDLLCGL